MGCSNSKVSSGNKAKGASAAEGEKRKQQMKKGKRGSISAERVDTSKLKNYVKPVYPKDSAAKAFIAKCLMDSNKMQLLFGHLGDAGRDDIINAFRETRPSVDQEVIRQGDEGDCLYIVYQGEVDVFISKQDENGSPTVGRGAKVASLYPGSLFGELALMYSSPRSATVTVVRSNTVLWALDREPFKMLLAKDARDTMTQHTDWLSKVDLFQTLSGSELLKLNDALVRKPVDAGKAIITQGTPGDAFYILESGHCAAYLNGSDGEKEVLKYTNVGSYFGELALLKDEPRKATVRAIGSGAITWVLSKENFENLLGPLKETLKKSADKYPQYADVLK